MDIKIKTGMIAPCLVNIEQWGIKAFIRNEKKRWACSECGGIICVHRGFCSACGKYK